MGPEPAFLLQPSPGRAPGFWLLVPIPGYSSSKVSPGVSGDEKLRARDTTCFLRNLEVCDAKETPL